MLIHRRTSVTNMNYHLVFVTKYKKTVFASEEKRDMIKDILQKIAYNKEVTIDHLEVMPDHVHMMISFHPKMAASDVVKSLKGTSAREWFKVYPETKKQLWGGHLWTGSFYMSTLGDVSKDIVANYIENQIRKR